MKARHYWDTTAFLAWLNDDPARSGQCRDVLEAARRGDLLILTSAATLTEVAHWNGCPRLGRDEDEVLSRFFLNEYILVRPLDRETGELGRRLLAEYPGLPPRHALHVATALQCQAPVLETFDRKLAAFNGLFGDPPLIIRSPHAALQIALF